MYLDAVATSRALEPAVAIGGVALAATVVATQWLVDPVAEAAFDAPKRLAAVVGLAVAAVATASLRRPVAGARGRRARAVLVLAGVAALAMTIAAVVSPRQPLALDTLRRLALVGLALPLGASRLLDGPPRQWVAGAFVAAATVNAVLALLEAAIGLRLFSIASVAGRGATGALVGNEGQLALLLALAAVGTLAVAIAVPRRRAALAGVVAVLVAGIAACGNVTAVLGLAAGSAVVLVRRVGRRVVVPLGAVAVAAGALLLVASPLGARGGALLAAARAGRWDDVTSNRFGAWAAATEMVRARPLAGFGPGTFGAEFVPHRLAAEIRLRRRLTTPVVTSSYGEAHNEPLQAAAEWGAPAATAATAAVLLLLVGVLARAGADAEALVLAGVLASAAVAALTWFPFQQASTSVPLLLVLGRAWRRLA